MARESARERREKAEKFQTFNRPKLKIAKTTEVGKTYIDYKDTESLKKLMSGNGKIQSRKRTGADAMNQRMLARAIKRARYMALLPYAETRRRGVMPEAPRLLAFADFLRSGRPRVRSSPPNRGAYNGILRRRAPP